MEHDGPLFAVILLASLLLVFGVVVIGKYMLRRIIAVLGRAASFFLPRELHLIPTRDIPWKNRNAVFRAADRFRQLGFQECGSYRIEEMTDTALIAFVKRAESIYGVVYEKAGLGVWMDLVLLYQDGTSLTCSNTSIGSELDHMPGHDKIYDKKLDAAGLYQRMMSERTQRPRKRISAEEFPLFFEKAYSEEMRWRSGRSGASGDEIRRVAEKYGIKADAEMIEIARYIQEMQASTHIEEDLRQQFLAESSMSAAEWENVRDRLFIIHDRLAPEMVQDIFYAGLGDKEVTDNEADVPLEGLTPREIFAALNLTLPEDDAFQKIGEVQGELPADFYLPPDDTPADE